MATQARFLSGGEQQMLGLARALATRPAVLMVDEPSLGLAPAVVSALFATIGQVVHERGISLMLIEQDPVAALNLSDYGYVMERGRIKLHGEPQELLESAELRSAYLGAGKELTR